MFATNVLSIILLHLILHFMKDNNENYFNYEHFFVFVIQGNQKSLTLKKSTN